MDDVHLSFPLRLPDAERERYERLDQLICQVSNHVLERHWSQNHLDAIGDSSYQAWTYFDEHDAFTAIDLSLPSRIRRCSSRKSARHCVRRPTVRLPSARFRTCCPSTRSTGFIVAASSRSFGTEESISPQATWMDSSSN
jgi:hypothetical protein